MSTSGNYDVFVSHASEDKENFVEPLVTQLMKMDLRVWYDDLSLELGDSLRENIDRGLAASAYGVVVVSPAFFEKQWPALELNGLVQKAMGEGRKVILPVWHNVGYDDVSKYSLPLANLVAARSQEGVEAVADKIARVVRGRGGVGNAESLTLSREISEQRLLSTAKGMIADPNSVVGVHELATALAKDAFGQLQETSAWAVRETPELPTLFERYRSISRSATVFCALAANLGHEAHFSSVGRVVSILAGDPGSSPEQRLRDDIWQYPVALVLYAIGLSALQRRRLSLVRHVLLEVRQAPMLETKRIPIVHYVGWEAISWRLKHVYRPSDNQAYLTPLSEHFYGELAGQVGNYFTDDREFEHVFDVFEYVLALAHAAEQLRSRDGVYGVPVGRYLWRCREGRASLAEISSAAEALEVCHALFDNRAESMDKVKAFIEKLIQERGF